MIPGNTSSQGKYSDQPTSVSATAGNTQATVSFTLPAYDGKGDATYVVTASPGGATASGSTSPITVTGLSNGTAYTFTVTTVTGYGVSAISTASGSVSPVAPPYFPPFFPPNFTPCPPAGSPATNATATTYCARSCSNQVGCLDANGCGYTCDGQMSYEYWCQGCGVGAGGYEGGYFGAYREGCCGYTSGGGGSPGGGGTPACTSCNATLTNSEYIFACEFDTVASTPGNSVFNYVERHYVTYGAPYSCDPAGCSPCSCPSGPTMIGISQVYYNYCP